MQEKALDYFVYSRGAMDWATVPGLVIGRVGYDNWLVDYATHLGLDTLDASHTVLAVHQAGVDGSKAGHKARPDKKYNIEMMNDHTDHGRTTRCRLELVPYNGTVNTQALLTVQGPPDAPATRFDAIEFLARYPAGKLTEPAGKLASWNRIDCKRHYKWWPCKEAAAVVNGR